MKTSASTVVLMGLFTMVLGGTIPRDTPANALDGISDKDFNALSTPCQKCSQIYKDCRKPCHYDYCESVCKDIACKSIVNGKECSSLCLWYC